MKNFVLLLILFIVGSHRVTAQTSNSRFIDSMLAEISTAKEDTTKARLLDTISYLYSYIDPHQGVTYGEQSKKLAEKLKWTRGIASATISLGINYASLSDYPTAIALYHQALKIYENTGDRNRQGAVLANISLAFTAQSNYPKALEYGLKALSIKEEFGDKKNMSIILTNIGTIYLELKNDTKAMEYYTQALKVCEELNDSGGIARAFGNIGIVHYTKGDYPKALEYHLKALSVNEGAGNKYSTQVNLANIGLVYIHMKNAGRALPYYFKALRLSEELDNKNSIAINLGNIGSAYYTIATDAAIYAGQDSLIPASRQANLRLAIDYLERAISICKTTNYTGPLIEFSKCLADAYYQAGKHKKAYETYKSYTAAKDSVFSIQSDLHIADLETRRELDLKDRDLQLKDKQLQINQLKIAQKRNERIIYIVSTCFLLVIIGIILKLMYAYRRSNRLLSSEKRRHLSLIESQIDRIQQQNDVLDEIAHIQSHDIRGPVATILGLSQLFNREDPADPENKTIIEGIAGITKKLDDAIKKVVDKKNGLGDTTEANQ